LSAGTSNEKASYISQNYMHKLVVVTLYGALLFDVKKGKHKIYKVI
jgi:hypothetical protein